MVTSVAIAVEPICTLSMHMYVFISEYPPMLPLNNHYRTTNRFEVLFIRSTETTMYQQ